MLEERKTIITSLSELLPCNMYNVKTGWDNCCINLSPQTLLDIAAYAQTHRAELEREAQENIKNLHAQLADTVEMHPVNPEWRYRTSDLQLSPPPTGDKSADEGAEYGQREQSRDERDTSLA